MISPPALFTLCVAIYGLHWNAEAITESYSRIERYLRISALQSGPRNDASPMRQKRVSLESTSSPVTVEDSLPHKSSKNISASQEEIPASMPLCQVSSRYGKCGSRPDGSKLLCPEDTCCVIHSDEGSKTGNTSRSMGLCLPQGSIKCKEQEYHVEGKDDSIGRCNCSSQEGYCPENSRCTPLTNGEEGLQCECEDGLIMRDGSCVEDPCKGNNCAPGFCMRTSATDARCSCPSNLAPSIPGEGTLSCVEKKFCSESACGSSEGVELCLEGNSTYRCVCQQGYILSTDESGRQTCIRNIEETAGPCYATSCGPGGKCQNKSGGRVCVCSAGYKPVKRLWGGFCEQADDSSLAGSNSSEIDSNGYSTDCKDSCGEGAVQCRKRLLFGSECVCGIEYRVVNGWSTQYCEKILTCADSPCGTAEAVESCEDLSDGDSRYLYRCHCKDGFVSPDSFSQICLTEEEARPWYYNLLSLESSGTCYSTTVILCIIGALILLLGVLILVEVFEVRRRASREANSNTPPQGEVAESNQRNMEGLLGKDAEKGEEKRGENVQRETNKQTNDKKEM